MWAFLKVNLFELLSESQFSWLLTYYGKDGKDLKHLCFCNFRASLTIPRRTVRQENPRNKPRLPPTADRKVPRS